MAIREFEVAAARPGMGTGAWMEKPEAQSGPASSPEDKKSSGSGGSGSGSGSGSGGGGGGGGGDGSGGKNQYLCKYCGKRCVCASALAVHLRTHSGEKPFGCKMCGKLFSRKSHLKVHQRVHSGEKPFICEVCDKSFSQMSNLRAHARVHTGERPFVCGFCEKSFAVSSSLKSHQRIHTGAHVGKAHICNICHRCFAWAGTLQKHKRLHEEGAGGPGTVLPFDDHDDAFTDSPGLDPSPVPVHGREPAEAHSNTLVSTCSPSSTPAFDSGRPRTSFDSQPSRPHTHDVMALVGGVDKVGDLLHTGSESTALMDLEALLNS